jgi:cobalt-zinc-cadmium efflux system protein
MSKHKETHNHSAPDFEQLNKVFYIGIALNAVYTIVEFVVGYVTNSLALLADASHNLGDVASLIISLIGMRLAQKAATLTYTYGYKKASILASLINSILLIVIVITIIKEGIERLSAPENLTGSVIIITALIGVIINSLSAFLFFKGQKHDINVKGAFLHLLVDALVSVSVVISGIIIYYTNWNIVDSLISFVIAIVIIISTWSLLKESLKLTLDGVPKNVDLNKIKSILSDNEHVTEFHHLHIWALGSSENALTVHLSLTKEYSLKEIMDIKNKIKHQLRHNNIKHLTIEFDDDIQNCKEVSC